MCFTIKSNCAEHGPQVTEFHLDDTDEALHSDILDSVDHVLRNMHLTRAEKLFVAQRLVVGVNKDREDNEPILTGLTDVDGNTASFSFTTPTTKVTKITKTKGKKTLPAASLN